MGLFRKFKMGLKRTQEKMSHEIRRVLSRSPKMTAAQWDEIEAVLLGADLGAQLSWCILEKIQKEYESQGPQDLKVFTIARREVLGRLRERADLLAQVQNGLTVVSLVGVNGSGKTTTTAKLANWMTQRNQSVVMAACDTFSAAAIEQLQIWGRRLDTPVVAGAYGADPASVGHDAVTSALAKSAHFLLVDTAGRLHTKNNLMQELGKLHRVIGRKLPGAPHEILLVIDASTGMNALTQARAFNKVTPITGLVITKLDGTSKAGMVVPIQEELNLPIKFVGLGEQADDLQPFDRQQFAEALFPDDEARS